MSKDPIMVATTSFSTEIDGRPEPINAGLSRLRASHPIVRQNPEFFKPVEDAVDFEVEETTAAPAEKRGEQKRGPGRPKKASAGS